MKFQDKLVKVLHSPETQKLWNSVRVSQIRSHSCKIDKTYPALCFQYTVQLLYNAIFSMGGAQWLSGRVLDWRQGPWVRASPASLRCGP